MFEESNDIASEFPTGTQSMVPAKRCHEEADSETEVQDGVDEFEDHEPWEEELGDVEVEARTAVHGWKELRNQIKKYLKKSITPYHSSNISRMTNLLRPLFGLMAIWCLTPVLKSSYKSDIYLL